MAVLCRPNEEPPDGWIYVQPETGARFKGWSIHELTETVREHRVWKAILPNDYATVNADIQRQICSGMPPGTCRPEPGENYAPFDDQIRNLSMAQMVEFSKASFRFIQSGADLVPAAESQRRAVICRGCRFNRPSPCIVCTPVFKVIDAMIPEHRKEPGLSACGICGCSLRAKILLPLTTLRDADEPQHLRFPPYCWLNDHGETKKESAQG